jgi:molybdopterin synthase catalytic subunit/molybdopterin converting factor small subunit
VRLTVRLFASLRERAGRESLVLDNVPAGSDVAAAKRLLESRHPELGSLQAVRGVLGTSYVADAARLSEGDELALLPPVSGGSGREGDQDRALARGVFELSSAPLDPGAAQRRVEHPSCGAAVVFTGNARDKSREREVVRLEYETFPAMAETEMAQVFEECRARVGGGDPRHALRMLVQHRTGTVAVGEPAVVVAVASPHRDAAFQAARFLIDELKARVPIWKKEVYADGHHWIGERS